MTNGAQIAAPLLEARRISKFFGAAVRERTFELDRGAVDARRA